MATTFDILIDIQARVEAIQNASNEMKNLTKEASSFTQAFKLGEMINLTGRLNDALREIPHLLGEAIKQGIEFNAEIQRTEVAIAGLFRQEAPGQFKTFDAAREAAAQTIDLLKAKANELGVAYADMFESFQHSQALLAAGGVKNVQEEIDLIAILNRAMQSVGVNSAQAARDISDLLQGSSRAAQTLGVPRLAVQAGLSTDEFLQAFERAKEAGTVADFIKEKFGGMAQAMTASAITFDGQVTRMSNALFDLKQNLAGPIMEPLTQGIENLTKALGSSDALAWVHTLGDAFILTAIAVRSVIDEIGKLGQAIKSNPVLDFIGKAASFAGKGVTAVSPLAPLAGFAQDVGGSIGDIFNLEKQLADLRSKQTATIDLQTGKLQEQTKFLELQKQLEDQINLSRARGSADNEAIAQAQATQAADKAISAMHDKKATQLEINGELLNEEQIWKAVYDATYKQATAVGGLRDSQRDFNAELRTSSDLLKDLKAQEQLINDNPANSPDDKQSALHNLFIQRQEEVAQKIDELRAKQQDPAIYGDPLKIEQVREAIRGLTTDYVDLEFKIQTTSFSGAVGDELLQWVNSFGSTAHQVAQIITGTLNTAIQGTSSAITGLIFGTQNWRQAFASVAQSIVQNIIQIGLQILIQQTVGAAIRKAFAAAELAATKGEAAAAHAAWAPAAIAASIATDGAAAGAGLLSYLGAEAAGTATAFIPGFHTGGVVDADSFHGGGLSRNERLVRALVGEGFFLPHQMANLFVDPRAEHLFKPEQLDAIGGRTTTSRNFGEPARSYPGGHNAPPGTIEHPTLPSGGGRYDGPGLYDGPGVSLGDLVNPPSHLGGGGGPGVDIPTSHGPLPPFDADPGDISSPPAVGTDTPYFLPGSGDDTPSRPGGYPDPGAPSYPSDSPVFRDDPATGETLVLVDNHNWVPLTSIDFSDPNWRDNALSSGNLDWHDNASRGHGRSPRGGYSGYLVPAGAPGFGFDHGSIEGTVGSVGYGTSIPFGRFLPGGQFIAAAGGGGLVETPPFDRSHYTMHEGGVVPLDALTGEAILNRDAVQGLGGAQAIHAINSLRFDVARPTFHDGGIIGGDSAAGGNGSGGLSLGSPEIHVFPVLDRDDLPRMLQDSSAVRKVVIDMLSDR